MLVALAAGGAIAMLGTGSSAAAATYDGFFPADKGSSLTLKVRAKHGERTAHFVGSGLVLGCDDDTSPVVDVPKVTLEFFGDTKFQGEPFERFENGDIVYVLIRGQLVGKHKARGSITYFDNPFDPPEGPYVPDCQTAAEGDGWKAARR